MPPGVTVVTADEIRCCRAASSIGIEQVLPGTRGRASLTHFESPSKTRCFQATVDGQRQWISGCTTAHRRR